MLLVVLVFILDDAVFLVSPPQAESVIKLITEIPKINTNFSFHLKILRKYYNR